MHINSYIDLYDSHALEIIEKNILKLEQHLYRHVIAYFFLNVHDRRRDLANDVDNDTLTLTRSRLQIRSIHAKLTRV